MDNLELNLDHNYLRITSISFLFAFFYFLMYSLDSETSTMEYILAGMILVLFICSQLFWYDPVQGSDMHLIDAMVAKSSIVVFILYTLLYKPMTEIVFFSYMVLFACLVTCFYYSNWYSKKEWCCDEHIFYHGLLHMVCYLGLYYAM